MEGQKSKPKKTQSVNLANPDETKPKANHKPLTTNHKPISNKLFVRFWDAGMCKTNKKRSESLFNSILKKQDDPEAFTEFLINDIKNRLQREQLGFAQMHPTTYLNGERWTDDLPKPQGVSHAANRTKVINESQAWKQQLRHNAEVRSAA